LNTETNQKPLADELEKRLQSLLDRFAERGLENRAMIRILEDALLD
jgi:hypothetical protein